MLAPKAFAAIALLAAGALAATHDDDDGLAAKPSERVERFVERLRRHDGARSQDGARQRDGARRRLNGGVDIDPFNPFNLTDCRNETAPEFAHGGRLRVLSWHIHYTTNTSDQPRFYEAFIARFKEYFPPSTDRCPFGPNYGSETYEYVCSLEDSYEEPWALARAAAFERRRLGEEPALGGSPWTTPQRAFFLPLNRIEEGWAWAQENQGYLDVLLHPNTGCMHDDHGLRGQWLVGPESEDAPVINVLEFPCNVPATGCNDTRWEGPPACGCNMPVASDAPEDSCGNCARVY